MYDRAGRLSSRSKRAAARLSGIGSVRLSADERERAAQLVEFLQSCLRHYICARLRQRCRHANLDRALGEFLERLKRLDLSVLSVAPAEPEPVQSMPDTTAGDPWSIRDTPVE